MTYPNTETNINSFEILLKNSYYFSMNSIKTGFFTNDTLITIPNL